MSENLTILDKANAAINDFSAKAIEQFSIKTNVEYGWGAPSTDMSTEAAEWQRILGKISKTSQVVGDLTSEWQILKSQLIKTLDSTRPSSLTRQDNEKLEGLKHP